MKEFDSEGISIDRRIPDWLDHPPDEEGLADAGTRWLQAVLRFTRPDGSPVFGGVGRSADRLGALEAWAERLGDPSLAGVVARWRPSGANASRVPALAPLPSDSRPDRVLAILRNDWDPRGELLAVDHRQPGDTSFLEVGSRGKTWIGPAWTSGHQDARFTRSEPTHWTSGTFAHCVEWSYKRDGRRITRVAALLRGRSTALLGQQVDGTGTEIEIRLGLAEGINASTVEGSRALLLSSGRGQATARLIPLGLPSHDRPTDRGSIGIEGREVVIRQACEGRRDWISALICWGKPPTTWRPLTVAYRSKATRQEAAVAYRVSSGRLDDDLVVYRSLADPELRCFLGHQTRSRFLLGTFNRAGDLRPILKVDA